MDGVSVHSELPRRYHLKNIYNRERSIGNLTVHGFDTPLVVLLAWGNIAATSVSRNIVDFTLRNR